MLLKTIRTPDHSSLLNIDLSDLPADQAIEEVKALKEEFFNSKGIQPVISEERCVVLYHDYTIHRVRTETKQIGNFAGDCKLPHNCVAIIVQNTPKDIVIPNIYITSDMEAYVISDTGVTVSVINGKKAAGEATIRMSGSVTIDSPTLNIHSGAN